MNGNGAALSVTMESQQKRKARRERRYGFIEMERLGEERSGWKKAASAALLILCLVLASVFFKAYMDGKFNSIRTLQAYVRGFGPLAPIALTAIQALQVVIPVLPGFLGCAVGAVLFGCMGGFWCNYIGICAGSIVAFFLARSYGAPLVRRMFPKARYHRWAAWAAQSKSYAALLFVGTLLPLFPDDFFCYFSGLTEMRARRFIWIILLGKPWCILLYSMIFASIR